MKRFWKRLEIQKLLEDDPIGAEVSYMDREADAGHPGNNWIVYYLSRPITEVLADDQIHIRKTGLEVVHFHKKKLDSIAETIGKNFNASINFDSPKQLNTDYFGTYYSFTILTDWMW